MQKPVLYLVIPCYNEQEVLPVTSKLFLNQINVRDFILNGQARVNEIIGIGENQNEDDDNTFGLML